MRTPIPLQISLGKTSKPRIHSTALALATTVLLIFMRTSAWADALDVWHTNANFAASGIAYGNGQFVAVSGTSLQVSPDGVAWTQYITLPALHYEGIIFGGGIFMAYGYPVSTNSSGPRHIMQSSDGLSWVKVYETPSPIRGATFGSGRCVFVGDRIISTTMNPFQWNEFQFPIQLAGVTFGNGRFVAVNAEPSGIAGVPPSGSAQVLSSADGIAWRYDYSAVNQSLRSIAYGNGMYVATWRTNIPNFGQPILSTYELGFLMSSNLTSWLPVKLASSGVTGASLAGIAFGGGYFISAVFKDIGLGLKYTYTSTSGLDWINRAGANGASTFSYGAGTFVASGDNTSIRQSDVVAPPTNPPPSYLTIANYPGVTIEGIEGQTYRIEYTTNLTAGSTWLTLTNLSLPGSAYLWVDTTSPAPGRRFYRAVLVE